VKLSYRNYRCNAKTFDQFLCSINTIGTDSSSIQLVALLVNPLHHTNSSALADWALRRGSTSGIHLVEAYSSLYWAVLVDVVNSTSSNRRIVAPLVSRHLDFLDQLLTTGTSSSGPSLPSGVSPEALTAALAQTVLLLGSAPVGPSTVQRVLSHSRRPPTVRFGSTETTLQVCGTPLLLSAGGEGVEERLQAFRAGWEHQFRGAACVGYYIGQAHDGCTEVRVVRSANRSSSAYMQDCDEGEPGYLVTRGENVMQGYVNADVSADVVNEEVMF
jgi:hypothetical protein